MKATTGQTRPKVLIVDDDDDVREVVSQTLSASRYDVKAFSDGADAIEAARHESFDLAVVDLKMPGTSGATVIKEIKKRQPDLPVVVITGSLDPSQEGLDGMFSRLLHKPFRIEELRKTVEEVLSR